MAPDKGRASGFLARMGQTLSEASRMNSLTQVLLDIARTANQRYTMDSKCEHCEDLLAALEWALDYIADGSLDETPQHDCEYITEPERGYCAFHNEYWKARLLLDKLAFDKSDELDDSERFEEREPSIDPQTGFES